jgi:hypothetical protein
MDYQMQYNAIARRIESCLINLGSGEIESAAIHVFPAIDATAKLRRPPPIGVGVRIKKFIDDDDELVSLIAFRGRIKGCMFNGKTIGAAIYDLARNPLMHEGELDPRMTFEATNGFTLGGTWNLPPRILLALAIIVVIAPENKDSRIKADIAVDLFGRRYELNEIWGKHQHFIDLIS